MWNIPLVSANLNGPNAEIARVNAVHHVNAHPSGVSAPTAYAHPTYPPIDPLRLESADPAGKGATRIKRGHQ